MKPLSRAHCQSFSRLLLAGMGCLGWFATARGEVHFYGGPGTTTFVGSGVTETGFGAGVGIDFGGHPLALALRADAGNFNPTGRGYWVHDELLELRLFLGEQQVRPYLEAGVGGADAPDSGTMPRDSASGSSSRPRVGRRCSWMSGVSVRATWKPRLSVRWPSAWD